MNINDGDEKKKQTEIQLAGPPEPDDYEYKMAKWERAHPGQSIREDGIEHDPLPEMLLSGGSGFLKGAAGALGRAVPGLANAFTKAATGSVAKNAVSMAKNIDKAADYAEALAPIFKSNPEFAGSVDPTTQEPSPAAKSFQFPGLSKMFGSKDPMVSDYRGGVSTNPITDQEKAWAKSLADKSKEALKKSTDYLRQQREFQKMLRRKGL